MPAVELPGADCGAYPDAVAETDAGADTCPDARADVGTDDGDARAHTGTVRKSDARTLITTDDSSPFVEADASALLVGSLLERQEYGSYRLR